jgi:aspartate-semialdehyde dehydrogenase
MPARIPVAVLGATGTVGQRFIQLLENHPWFDVRVLTGSDRSVGQPYAKACHWLMDTAMPAWAKDTVIVPTLPADYDVTIAFSALPANIAKDVEPVLAQKGIAVCSNASAYRKEPDVPILLPEVNAEHAEIIRVQRARRGWGGCIVTNPNCTSTGLTVALKALQNAYGLRKLLVVSMQAVSGAGYPGIASLDILDNVVPYIGDEEPKLEWEPRKMLGTYTGDTIQLADLVISAHTNRVPVREGHTVCVSVETAQAISAEEAAHALKVYTGPEIARGLPSAPQPVIQLREEPDRPQPRLEIRTGNGMTTVVGRLRPDPIFGLKMVIYSHNTIRGAAGGAIFNAELLVKMGLAG